jgi:hypothetical protein
MKLGNFLVIIIILSVILIGLSWGMSSRIEDKECTNVTLKRSLRGLLMLSMFSFMISLSLIINLSKQLWSGSSNPNVIYLLVFVALLGLTIIILSSVIAASASTETECNNFIDIIIPTIIIGCILFMFSILRIRSTIRDSKMVKTETFKFKSLKRSYY